MAVRPCNPKFEGKTYLGILIGEIALSQSVQYVPETGELKVSRVMHNPMIFIPEKKTVVFGCNSWWRLIESESQLKTITDADIDNVWYVRALRALTEHSERPANTD